MMHLKHNILKLGTVCLCPFSCRIIVHLMVHKNVYEIKRERERKKMRLVDGRKIIAVMTTATSVTSKKLSNVYKSCLKMISLEK